MRYDEIMQGVKAERVDAAVRAAAELYLERGIDAVKMTDIAERSQLGVASLYRYFGTKQHFTIQVASYIWKEQLRLYEGVYDSDYYKQKTGIEQVEELMKIFKVLLCGQSRFVHFITDFDAFVAREGIGKNELSEYEQSALKAETLMEAALTKGKEDGTVRSDIDGKLYYFTASRCLMAMCRRLAAKGISNGASSKGGCEDMTAELCMAIEIFVDYARAR